MPARGASAVTAVETDAAPERMEDLLHVDPLELEIGFGLVSLVDGDAAGCHCRSPQIEQELRGALKRSATSHGVAVRSID